MVAAVATTAPVPVACNVPAFRLSGDAALAAHFTSPSEVPAAPTVRTLAANSMWHTTNAEWDPIIVSDQDAAVPPEVHSPMPTGKQLIHYFLHSAALCIGTQK